MSNLQAELYIRKQIQRILLEKTEDQPAPEPPKETETQSGQGRVFGSAGRGRLPKEIAEIFAGEDGSAAEPKRLATSNPMKLMKNLKVSRAKGDTAVARAKSLIENARAGTEIFRTAIGNPDDRKDAGGRTGVFFPNAGLPNDRLANLFVYDTLRAAATVGYIQMTGHLRVEQLAGGVIIFNVRNEGERWQG